MNKPAQQVELVSIKVLDDLCLLVVIGEKAIQVKLSPRHALELAAELLVVGLQTAEANAISHTGAKAAIDTAMEPH